MTRWARLTAMFCESPPPDVTSPSRRHRASSSDRRTPSQSRRAADKRRTGYRGPSRGSSCLRLGIWDRVEVQRAVRICRGLVHLVDRGERLVVVQAGRRVKVVNGHRPEQPDGKVGGQAQPVGLRAVHRIAIRVRERRWVLGAHIGDAQHHRGAGGVSARKEAGATMRASASTYSSLASCAGSPADRARSA